MYYSKIIVIIYYIIKTCFIILSIKLSLSFNKNYNIDFIRIQNIYKKNIQKYFDKNNYFIIKNNNSKIKEKKNNLNKLRVALCVVAKQENLYIKEFIDYYLKLGFNKIFLYDNNNLNGENFEKILYKEIKEGFIKITDFRGMFKPQKKAYNHCYYNNKKTYDWIAFYDVDEFLYISNYTNIQQFLSLPRFDLCSSILINWRYYGDNNNIYYNNNPMHERFTEAFQFQDNKIYDKYLYAASKSIIRGGLNITWGLFPHYLKNSTVCSQNGTIIENPHDIRPDYTSVFIKHFATKSTEEYIIKLIKGTVNSNYTLDIDSISYYIKNYYFLFNKKTRKKLLLFKKILNIKI